MSPRYVRFHDFENDVFKSPHGRVELSNDMNDLHGDADLNEGPVAQRLLRLAVPKISLRCVVQFQQMHFAVSAEVESSAARDLYLRQARPPCTVHASHEESKNEESNAAASYRFKRSSSAV
jgi:hypothetical protein